VYDFLRAQNDGQFLRLLGKRKHIREGPFPLEGDLVEEAKCRNSDVYRTGSKLLLIRQIDLICANVLGSQRIRRLAEVASERVNDFGTPCVMRLASKEV
jgi:hypothetical protein